MIKLLLLTAILANAETTEWKSCVQSVSSPLGDLIDYAETNNVDRHWDNTKETFCAFNAPPGETDHTSQEIFCIYLSEEQHLKLKSCEEQL